MEYLWCIKLNAPVSVAVCKNNHEACHQVTYEGGCCMAIYLGMAMEMP